MPHDATHEHKYRSFLDGLQAYLAQSAAPKKPRQGSKFAPLLAWRDKRNKQALPSNWSTSPANDNSEPEADADERDFATEMRIETVPSLGAIEAAFKHVKRVERREAKLGGGGKPVTVPVGGDMDFGINVDDEGGKHKIVTRIGSLQFSDGTQTEKAHKRATGNRRKTVGYRAVLPVGAMRGTRERLTGERGSKAKVGKRHLQMMLGAKHRYLPGTVAKKGKSFTADQSRAMLAEALANTPVMPTVTVLPPGIASGSPDCTSLFLGFQKARKGHGGATAWEDLYVANRNRAEWRAAAMISSSDRKVLDAAMTARNYADIGRAAGYSGSYAAKAGKRLLTAANDNLSAAIKKIAA